MRLVTLIAAVMMSLSVAAQTPAAKPEPTVKTERGVLAMHQILDILGKEFEDYVAAMPNFYADEILYSRYRDDAYYPHSQVIGPIMVTSTFHVQRLVNERGEVSFRDVRVPNALNGKPVKEGEVVHVPMLPGNIFGYLLAVVAPQYRVCEDFAFHRILGHGNEVFIQFTPKKTPIPEIVCPAFFPVSGHIDLDRTLTVEYIQITKFHSQSIPGLETVVQWSMPFSPTPLGVKMPHGMGATIFTNYFGTEKDPFRINGKTAQGKLWQFDAFYRNYHKTEVTSKVLPGVGHVESTILPDVMADPGAGSSQPKP